MLKGLSNRHLLPATAAVLMAATPGTGEAHALAPPTFDAQAAKRSLEAGVRSAGEIAAQPVHDVGLMNPDIPDVLVQASKSPYGLAPSPTCEQLSGEIEALTAAIGPDMDFAEGAKENRIAQLAVAGGKTVVNSFIPFRMLVREVSGAAPAQRRYQDAVNIGLARRGFLRGVYRMQNCEPALLVRSAQ